MTLWKIEVNTKWILNTELMRRSTSAVATSSSSSDILDLLEPRPDFEISTLRESRWACKMCYAPADSSGLFQQITSCHLCSCFANIVWIVKMITTFSIWKKKTSYDETTRKKGRLDREVIEPARKATFSRASPRRATSSFPCWAPHPSARTCQPWLGVHRLSLLPEFRMKLGVIREGRFGSTRRYFGRPVLGFIEADLCKQILNNYLEAFNIYKMCTLLNRSYLKNVF